MIHKLFNLINWYYDSQKERITKKAEIEAMLARLEKPKKVEWVVFKPKTKLEICQH